MKKYPKVAVVILNWNGRHFLEQFLPSVLASSYPNFQVFVGDNASTDDSIAFLKQHYPQVEIIRNDQNLGFAGGYNQILRQVEADYFVLLNSDVEVVKNWIEPVIELLEGNEQIAAAQPKILSHHDKSSFEYAGAAGGWLDFMGYPFCRGRIFDSLEKDTGQYQSATQIFWASGAALFIRKKAWQEVNGFDGDFFAHMEEIDLCWRLKNRGYQIWYCPEAIVYHVGGGTLAAESPFKIFLNFRNNLWMIHKNTPASTVFFKLFIRFFMDFLSLLKYLLDDRPKNALAISKAHVAFLRNLRRNAAKREKITPNANNYGFYSRSIVWDYFILKRSKFKDLFV